MQLKLYVPQMQNKKLKDFPHQDKNFQFMFSSTVFKTACCMDHLLREHSLFLTIP